LGALVSEDKINLLYETSKIYFEGGLECFDKFAFVAFNSFDRDIYALYTNTELVTVVWYEQIGQGEYAPYWNGYKALLGYVDV